VRTPYTTVDGVDLVFYEVPSGGLAAALEPPSVTSFFQWVTALLGPFPYGSELRFAGAPTAWLGFEHPANIILNEGLSDASTSYANTLMHVFMHEIVHQWAGDRSTLAMTADFVWKEATAEYLAYVFEDEQRPPVEATSSLAYWDSISLQADHYPRPTDEPTPAVQDFYGDVYGPGPMVLYVQLESMLGRDVVLQGIQGFLATPGARGVGDLQAALEAASSSDLSAYFNAWVFGVGKPEWPTLQVTTAQAGDQVTVTVTQQNASAKLYGCLVEVEVNGATQTTTALVDFGVAPTSATATATVTLAEPVVSTQLDPNHRLVARQSPNVSVKPEPKLPVWIF
jgi:aminopeptidase N